MRRAAKIVEKELLDINFLPSRVPVISNYTARPNVSTIQIVQLLVGQISNVVRWTESIKLMSARYNVKHFIECGPGKILSGLISRILIKTDCKNLFSKEDFKSIEKIV
jgi:[acyl-carrier-protein] S-malonyltransferase